MDFRNPTLNEVSLLEHVVESMNDMVCVVDKDYKVLYANAKMEKVIGARVAGLCPGKLVDSGCETCFAKACIEQGRPQNMTFELNGRVYSVAISPIRDEMGEILSALEVWSDVTGERRLKERLTSQNDLLKSDLKLASTLQQSMLPLDFAKDKGLNFDMMYRPCEDVGGDFYDIFMLNDDEVAFYIADVSGHGVSAAMLTVFFSQTVKSIMDTKKGGIKPGDVLLEVWKRFLEIDIQEHLYITAWMGVMNTKTGMLNYSSAGHIISPIMFDGQKVTPLDVKGFPICRWITAAGFPVGEIEVPKGGRILLYTDGLSDAWRMVEKPRAETSYKNPDELAEGCIKMDNFNEILETIWNGVNFDDKELKLSDDVAMLVVERT